MHIKGTSDANGRMEIRMTKKHNKSDDKFNKNCLEDNPTQTNRVSGDRTKENENQEGFKMPHFEQCTKNVDGDEPDGVFFIVNRDTKLKQSILMINKRPVKIQISKDDIPSSTEKNYLLRRIAMLEQQNIKIQDQLNNMAHVKN